MRLKRLDSFFKEKTCQTDEKETADVCIQYPPTKPVVDCNLVMEMEIDQAGFQRTVINQLNFLILDIYKTFQNFSFDRESECAKNLTTLTSNAFRISKLNSVSMDDHLVAMRELNHNLETQLKN